MTGDITGVPLPELSHACAYLPDRTASFEHYQFVTYDDDAFCLLVENGFRHFGSYFFRPRCPGATGLSWCGACVPLRIRVAAFAPSRSQRRVRRRASGLTLDVDTPRYSDEKYELYARHKQRFARTTRALGLPVETTAGATDPETFRTGVYDPCPFTREFTYRLGGRLVGAGLVDVASRVVSSIYFYFDPDFAHLSPGTYSVLREIEFARAGGASHYYLGYLVRGNPSMRYKEAFRPNEVFDGGDWRPFLGIAEDAPDITSVGPSVRRHGPFLTPRGPKDTTQ